jgi:hypothetical protein
MVARGLQATTLVLGRRGYNAAERVFKLMRGHVFANRDVALEEEITLGM